MRNLTSYPDANGWQPYNPMVSGGIDYSGFENQGQGTGGDDDCKKKREAMGKFIDSLTKNASGKTPDCSGEKGCELATVIIDLGEPCKRNKKMFGMETGHAGVAVGGEFYDVRPGGMSPFTAEENGVGDETNPQPLNNIEGIFTNSSAGVIAVEFCVCKARSAAIREIMTKASSGKPDPTHCSGAVWCALSGGPLLLHTGRNPYNLATSLTTESGPLGIEIDNRPPSQCGASKGEKANVRVISKP